MAFTLKEIVLSSLITGCSATIGLFSKTKLVIKASELFRAETLYSVTVVPSSEVTIAPESGVAQDFSENKKVIYTVTSEDGTVIKEYQVFISGTEDVYDFEKWLPGVEGQEPENTFYEAEGWASSNTGAHFLKGFNLTDSYVIMQTDDSHSGTAAAKIQSIDTKGQDLGIEKLLK